MNNYTDEELKRIARAVADAILWEAAKILIIYPAVFLGSILLVFYLGNLIFK